MRAHVFAHEFRTEAAARFRVSGAKIVIGCNKLISAFTNAVPKGMGVFPKKESDNLNSAKSLPRYVFLFHTLNNIAT